MLHCITHWPVCPGVFIAFLAFVAVIVTFRLTPETTKPEKAFWVLLCFGLMFGEVWMMSKDRDAHDAEQKEARKLAVQQSARLDWLTLQGVGESVQLADINRKIESAKGNPQLVQSLEKQAKAKRERINDISTQLASASVPLQVSATAQATIAPASVANSQFSGLRDDALVKLAKDTVIEIKEHMQEWKAREDDINASRQNQLEILQQNGKANSDELQKLDDNHARALKDNEDRFGPSSKDLFIRANNIRDSLIVRLRQKGVQNPTDNSVDDAFAALAARGPDGYSDQRAKWVWSELSDLAGQLR